MSKFRVQTYSATLTVAIGTDSISHTPVAPVNGLIRSISITSTPASITGSSYGIKILGSRGQTLYSKATIATNADNVQVADANNQLLSIPVNNNGIDQPLIKIDIAGDSYAATTLTSDNSGNVTNNKIVTIGSTVYTFKTALTGGGATANEILIGADNDDSLLNLKKAINAEAGSGTKYGSATVINPDVASGNVTSHAIVLTAKTKSAAVNALATTTNETTLSFTGATLTDGGEASARSFTVDLLIERG